MALSVEDEVVHLVLRREETRNAISPAVLTELEEALADMERVRDAKLLVLRGEGRVFSVGADLAAAEPLPLAEAEEFFRRGRAIVDRIQGLGILTLAAVNGLALGGGFELALACDLRWAHASAVFGFPEARLGLIPGWRGIRNLSRLLPSSEAMELLVGGEYMGARAARGFGLVSRIFEGRDFLDQVRAGLAGLRTRKAAALRAIKALVRSRSDEAFDTAESLALGALWAGRDGGGTDGPAGA